MMKKQLEINDATFNTDSSVCKAKRSCSQNTDNSRQSSTQSSGSSRSKYLCANKLIRATLFQSINGRKGSLQESQEGKMEVQLLQDTLCIARRRQHELLVAIKSDFRGYRDEGRRLMRLLEHLTQ